MVTFTRRQALGAVGSASLLAANWSAVVSQALASEKTLDRFLFGVASGDPTHSSVVIWTRINMPTSHKKTEKVKWVVAEDSDFKTVIRSGKFKTNSERDFSVKVNVEKLAPGHDLLLQV